MNFVELQECLLRRFTEKKNPYDIDKLNIPDYETTYIIAVVKYIDDYMNSHNECISVKGLINNMRRVIEKINTHSTGIPDIDSIVARRASSYLGKNDKNLEGKYYIFCKDPEYVENFVSILSQYGGLYKFVCSHADDSLIDDNCQSVFLDVQHYTKTFHL